MFVCLKAHVNDRMCVLSVCVCVCLSVCTRLEMLTKLPISCLCSVWICLPVSCAQNLLVKNTCKYHSCDVLLLFFSN